MKKDLHPDQYREVIFEDLNNGSRFITRSTALTEETAKWEDGKEYPLVKVHISSASHPFYTGQEKLVDVEGRVDRFKARQDAAKKKQDARTNKAKKAQKKQDDDADEPQSQKVGGGSHQNKTPKPKAKQKSKPQTKPKAEPKTAVKTAEEVKEAPEEKSDS